jgi:hypothetical protein
MNTSIRAETIIGIKVLLLSEGTVYLVKSIYNVFGRIFFIKIFPITSRPGITWKKYAHSGAYCVRVFAREVGGSSLKSQQWLERSGMI